jgi:hypothetical protein
MIEKNLRKDQKAVPINREALRNIYCSKSIMKRLINSAEQQLIGKK